MASRCLSVILLLQNEASRLIRFCKIHGVIADAAETNKIAIWRVGNCPEMRVMRLSTVMYRASVILRH
jgi:hypothetical protein